MTRDGPNTNPSRAFDIEANDTMTGIGGGGFVRYLDPIDHTTIGNA